MNARILLLLLLVTAASPLPTFGETAADAPEPKEPTNAAPAQLPHLDLNVEQRYIDLPGEVCLTEGMLELLVTIRAAKEHESVFLVKARPQHVHFALLMLGLKPGHPGRWVYNDKETIPVDPKGDRVAAFVLLPGEAGKVTEVPINKFVKNRKTGELLESNVFVFGGSKIVKPEQDDPYYAADSTGDVIALVSFNDELLAIPKAASNSNDQVHWVVNTDAVPALGTPVKIRLRPAGQADKPDTESSS